MGQVDSREAMCKFLASAEDAICGDRNADYGPPEVNHARTAALWSAYLNVPITAREVCLLNILQKCSRDAHCQKYDNLLDIAGWAANGSVCR